MYQNVEIIGRVGRDPETHIDPATNSQVTSFNVAISRGPNERPLWYRVSAWGKLSNLCAERIVEGALVHVNGKMSGGSDGYPRMWKRSDGTLSASFELVARTVNVLFTGAGAVSTETANDYSNVEYR